MKTALSTRKRNDYMITMSRWLFNAVQECGVYPDLEINMVGAYVSGCELQFEGYNITFTDCDLETMFIYGTDTNTPEIVVARQFLKRKLKQYIDIQETTW